MAQFLQRKFIQERKLSYSLAAKFSIALFIGVLLFTQYSLGKPHFGWAVGVSGVCLVMDFLLTELRWCVNGNKSWGDSPRAQRAGYIIFPIVIAIVIAVFSVVLAS